MLVFAISVVFALLISTVDGVRVTITTSINVNELLQGSDVLLNCTVTSNRSVDSVEWLKDQVSITKNITLENDKHGNVLSSLLLEKVYHANTTGTYTCSARQGVMVTSSYIQLEVKSLPKVTVSPSWSYINKYVGESEVVICKATGIPTPQVQWLVTGGYVITDDAIQKKGDRVILNLKNLKMKDDGSILVCRANNSVGEDKKTLELYISEPPNSNPAKLSPSNQTVYGYRGNNATFSFQSQYTDEFFTSKKWTLHGKELQSSPSKYKTPEPVIDSDMNGVFTVTVQNLTDADSGIYTLEVQTNIIPPAFASAHLIVTDPVEYEIHPVEARAQLATGDDAVQLKCSATHPKDLGQQGVVPYWAINGTRLIPAEHYAIQRIDHDKGYFNLIHMILTIRGPSQSDCVSYTCGMSTSQGYKEALVFLDCKQTKNRVRTEQPTSSISPMVAWIPITAVSSIMLLVGLGLAFILFRKKAWKKYGMFKGFKIEKEPSKFDVFISYTGSDFDWVSKQLIPLLEKNKISYSIHSKDFELGKPIVDNMADSVYQCKLVMAVISEKYMASKFCRAELDMAMCRNVAMAEATLTVIKLGGVGKSKFPKKLNDKIYVESVKQGKDWEKHLTDHLIPLVGSDTNI